MAITIILLVAQILTMTAWGEGNLRKTPEGEKLLARLSAMGLFFLNWRAYADYKKEMKFLCRAMGWLAIASVVVFYLLPVSARPVVSVYCVSFMGLWLSMRVGVDVKGQLMDMLGWAALFFCLPLLLLFADYLHAAPFSLLHAMASPIRLITEQGLMDYQVALILAALGGVVGLSMALMNMILFSIIPLLLLFLMVFFSKISRFLLGRSVNTARNLVAFYVLVMGPTLIVMHALQVI
ncbi:hypothetical protein [Pseudomonas cichorii]|uniref:hypothetical protein n=1 Tax=Pseudomonas cichorii TaxID=36746 RepID=UPI001C89BB6F|nr:hypothetical protein [Pseudomonas cichorii]MBX8486161.1 hypothetical protein [Pseudomonas cichorii]